MVESEASGTFNSNTFLIRKGNERYSNLAMAAVVAVASKAPIGINVVHCLVIGPSLALFGLGRYIYNTRTANLLRNETNGIQPLKQPEDFTILFDHALFVLGICVMVVHAFFFVVDNNKVKSGSHITLGAFLMLASMDSKTSISRLLVGILGIVTIIVHGSLIYTKAS